MAGSHSGPVAKRPKAKRRYHTGSIVERDTGLFVGQVSFGKKPDGTRDRRTFSSHVEADVEVWLRNQIPWVADPDGLPVPAHRLDAWMERWLGSLEGTVRPTTLRGYESFNRVWIAPLIGTIPLARLSVADVRKVPAAILRTQTKAKKQRSPATAAAALLVLRMALAAAVRDGYLSRNVALAVKPPRANAGPVTAITVEEAQAILRATDASDIGPIVAVAIGTGLRIGEILAIRPADLRADAVTITGSIKPTPGPDGYTMEHQLPKTRRSVRSVSLTAIAKRGFAEQKRRDKAAGRIPAYVFTGPHDGKLDPRQVADAFQAELRKAGLPAMRFHDLRHAYATLMLGAGVPLRVVQASLGHSSIAVTAAIYAHVMPELSRTGAEQFDRLLEKG